MEDTTENTTIEQTITRIAQVAPKVREEHANMLSAIDAERNAEATVLTHAIELARPALRALCSRIVMRSYETGGQNGCNPVSETEYFEDKGVRLVNGYDRVKDSTGNRGSLTGTCLYLMWDGTLALVSRTGTFSHWQGEADVWEAEMKRVTPRQAMDQYDLEDVLSSLSTCLHEQVSGRMDVRAQKARERSERLQAIAKLVGR